MSFHWLKKFGSQGIGPLTRVSRSKHVSSSKRVSSSTRVSAETIDVCAARLFTIALLVAVVLSANLIVVHAAPQTASTERALFDAANRERAAQGLHLMQFAEV